MAHAKAALDRYPIAEADNPPKSMQDLLTTKAMHVNFYDNDAIPLAVQSGIVTARNLLDELDNVDAKLSRDRNRRSARKPHQ